MTVKKKRIMLFSSVLSLFIVFVSAFTISIGVKAKDEIYPDAAEVQIRGTFWLNDVFMPPKASVADDFDGRVNAGTKLVFPSGKVKQDEKYVLNEDGKYTLIYFSESDFPTEVKRDFIVCKHVFESDGKVRPYYGAPEQVPERPGIIITLGNGEVFRYNKVIDFSTLTKDKALIKMYVLPNTIGTSAAMQIIYTFTDTENPDNYLTVTQQTVSAIDDIMPNDDWAVFATYIKAGATGQIQCGWEGKKFHRGNKYGTWQPFSMNGRPQNGDFTTQELTISMDYENLKVMTNNGKTEIIDLNDPTLFSNIWHGFKKGTAYLSVSCGQFNDPTSTFVITNIGDCNFVGSNDEKITDTEKPRLIVNSGKDIPEAIKGEPYKLFGFEATDNLDKHPGTGIRVYINYGSNIQSECPIADNAFIPETAGEYTIEYTAVDYYGNRAVEIRKVKAKEKRDVELSLDVACGESGVAGEIFKAGEVTVNGAIGSYEISGAAVCVYEGREYVYPLDENFEFRPEYAGEYILNFKVTDYIGSYECEKCVAMKKDNAITIPENPILPEFMIKGSKYELPEIYGVDYSKGYPEKQRAKISVSENIQDLAGSVFTPSVIGKKEIIYTVDNGKNKATKICETTVVDVGYGGRLNLDKYFYGDGFTVEKGDDSITVSATRDTTVKFINPVDRNFKFNFTVVPDRNNFDSLTLVFSDSKGEGESLGLEFIHNEIGKDGFVRINGGDPMITGGSFNGDRETWNVRYNSGFNSLSVGEFVDYRTDGNLFPSGRVKIEFSFKGVKEESGIKIECINNQVLSSASRDKANPQISFLGHLNKNAERGSTIHIPAAIATDILDNNVEFSLTILDPGNNYVKSSDGIILSQVDPTREYEFKAELFGQYKAEFTAKDTSGRKQTLYTAFNVNDTTLPEIRLDGNMPGEGKVSERVDVPKADIIDDTGEELKYYLYLERPDGVIIRLYTVGQNKDGSEKFIHYDGFVPQAAGLWKVVYYAFDGSGNTETMIYEIMVK